MHSLNSCFVQDTKVIQNGIIPLLKVMEYFMGNTLAHEMTGDYVHLWPI